MKEECLGSLMGDPLCLSLKARGYGELILLPSEVQMFASPDQEPKCPWLRKRLNWLNNTMGSPCLFPALPSHPRPGGQQETSHSLWR